ncbi:MAG TPA: DUF523 domain-containing protein [Anaeromyxobacteraceae bacterium]|nr:DUF523 domain-containing protein [Anaeromyxobacteraceae bacterium]
MTEPSRPRIGISACLTGAPVRWDGRDKRHARLLEALGPFVDWLPVCPEVEVGMGVPREPIALVAAGGRPRLLGERSGVDHTEAMRIFAARRVDELIALGIQGWISKKGSPSCGPGGVPIRSSPGGGGIAEGAGLFVSVLRERLPDLPIADEGQLEDAALRQGFLARCRAQRPG